MEGNLEMWRYALERRGIKISRSKTRYMCSNKREADGKLNMQGAVPVKGDGLKYLESTIQSKRCEEENGDRMKSVETSVQGARIVVSV